MGIVPTPDTYGDDCLLCYGAGLTPNTFKVFFSGIKKGIAWNPLDGEPPNGYYDLVQDPLNPCRWVDQIALWPKVILTHFVGRSELTLEVRAGVLAFGQSLAPQCSKHFTTEFIPDWGLPFWDGYAIVSTVKNLSDIVEGLTPMIDPDPRLECWSMADDIIVVRYAGKRDATRIYIKVDTNP